MNRSLLKEKQNLNTRDILTNTTQENMKNRLGQARIAIRHLAADFLLINKKSKEKMTNMET